MKYFTCVFFITSTAFYAWMYYVECLELQPGRPDITYFNKKYLRDMKVTVARRRRNSPYYISLTFETLKWIGDNVTLKWSLYEHLGGRYVDTHISMTRTLCDFLYNEPYFGKMYAKQLLDRNWSCPIEPGLYSFKNLVVHLEKFPYKIPFMWFSYRVEARVKIWLNLIPTNESLVNIDVDCTITQKSR